MSELKELTTPEHIALDSLVGSHAIDGRAEFVGHIDNGYCAEDAAVFVLRLDDKLYWFQEDPGDGYRSGLAYARICTSEELPPGSLIEFAPIGIRVELRDDGQETICGIVESTDSQLFEVGTFNTDDYYPSFVASWTP
jgi:hypothetical protein